MDIQTIRWDTRHGWSSPLPADHPDALVLVFADPAVLDHPGRPLEDILRRFKRAAVIGCSTTGQVAGDAVSDDSIVVTIARFVRTQLNVVSVDVAHCGGARRAGRTLGRALRAPQLRGALVLSSGRAENTGVLAAGLADELPSVFISGGVAGGHDQHLETWVIAEGRPRSGWATAVGFLGDHVEVGFGAGSGWDTYGHERVVTRSHAGVVYELDSRPALAVYRDYLDVQGPGTPPNAADHPMSIRDLDDHRVVRRVLSVDDSAHSICFAGDVAQGSLAQILKPSKARLIESAHDAAKQASTGREQLAIAISCVGRRSTLGARTADELHAVLEALHHGTALSGFYAESGMSLSGGACNVHNQSMTITTISESPDSSMYASLDGSSTDAVSTIRTTEAAA